MRDAERRAVAAVFLLLGVLSGTFASRLPWISDRLHLSSGRLGLALLATSVGATMSVPFSGRLVQRFGARAASCGLMWFAAAALALTAFMPNLPALCAATCLFGVGAATTDMAMNSQGILVEKRLGRSIMSGLHGMWSVGALTGAFTGSIAARLHVDGRAQFTVGAGVVAVLVLVATRRYRTTPEEVGVAPQPADSTPRIIIPKGRILLIGLVGFCGIFPEVAAQDWSAVYMHRTLHGSEAQAALTTGMFGVTMAVGRLTGDSVVRRWGAGPTVRACGVFGAIGALLVVVAQSAIPAIAGFMLIGVGVSVVVPLAFAAAGHAGPDPTLGVAGVATVAYGAGLAAPGLIGGIADLTSLRFAFTIVAALAGMIAVGAGLLDRAGGVESARSLEAAEVATAQ
jgi:MFS family permease